MLCGEDCCRFILHEETTRKRMMSSVLGLSDSGRMTRSGTGVKGGYDLPRTFWSERREWEEEYHQFHSVRFC